MGEKGDKLRQAAALADQEEELREEQKKLTSEMQKEWLSGISLDDHFSVEKNFAQKFEISLTDAKKMLKNPVTKYEIEGKDIPAMIKSLRKYRRSLNGEPRKAITESIDGLIKAYSDHLDKSIDEIYWIAKYKPVLKEMNCSEENLLKLSKIDDLETRRNIIDVLCKYWEDRLDFDAMQYETGYGGLSKAMTASKREFKQIIKNHTKRENQKDVLASHIVKSVSEEPGISSRQIHERLPKNLFKKSSPTIISKIAKVNNITQVDGAFYKLSDDIKKNIYAYTAAFIDSDGYITMDRNFNPRVGLVATGDRGKAFMMEMHKSLGCGRLHLDQKSPQDTRPVNRLNFYSGADVTELLTKCLPHFKMKKGNAEILLELVRMKKSHKKADWYKQRREELFKLMKYENHKDHVGFNWSEFDIDVNSIEKLYGNNKMNEMDRIEGIIKSSEVDEAIDDLEEIAEEHELSEDEWSSVDDASDYLFEHKVMEDK
tara:strand:- start:1240 stop:2697 length:1458 start_codon:yes stop_codon:yes gene_type:complete